MRSRYNYTRYDEDNVAWWSSHVVCVKFGKSPSARSIKKNSYSLSSATSWLILLIPLSSLHRLHFSIAFIFPSAVERSFAPTAKPNLPHDLTVLDGVLAIIVEVNERALHVLHALKRILQRLAHVMRAL